MRLETQRREEERQRNAEFLKQQEEKLKKELMEKAEQEKIRQRQQKEEAEARRLEDERIRIQEEERLRSEALAEKLRLEAETYARVLQQQARAVQDHHLVGSWFSISTSLPRDFLLVLFLSSPRLHLCSFDH